MKQVGAHLKVADELVAEMNTIGEDDDCRRVCGARHDRLRIVGIFRIVRVERGDHLDLNLRPSRHTVRPPVACPGDSEVLSIFVADLVPVL